MRPGNLPAQVSSFVGRERELAELGRLLAATRLLTLTGVGGVGKTRLALAFAAGQTAAHPDGVWLVELAALGDPSLVPQAVAMALGVREQPGRPLRETPADAVRPRQLLLVLDNCEHLVEAGAKFADALLRACPRLRIVATSREALRIDGETAWLVPPLAVPDPDPNPGSPRPAAAHAESALAPCEAVRLFVDRGAAARSNFALTDRNAPAVTAICRRLDGIPLAIELAAARVKALSPAQIAARLDDRFRLLAQRSRTALPRHRTLQALVDWSHELLSEPERALFGRLSVFAGGCTLEAAEAVCAGEGVEAEEVVDLPGAVGGPVAADDGWAGGGAPLLPARDAPAVRGAEARGGRGVGAARPASGLVPGPGGASRGGAAGAGAGRVAGPARRRARQLAGRAGLEPAPRRPP